MDTARQEIRAMVRGGYAIQKLRIQAGNRIVANFKVKLGQEPGKSEEILDTEGKKILKDIRASYKKITDGVKSFPRIATFKGDGVISSYTELCLTAQYESLATMEKEQFTRLAKIVGEFAIWNTFLHEVKGVGPAMAGVLLSEIDISVAKYPSSLWAYAGLDVAGDGRGRSKKKEHLVEVEYKNAKGEMDTRMSITFNPFLKTKLMGVLAGSFIKTSRYYTAGQILQMDETNKSERKKVKPEGSCKSPYTEIYYEYKHRLECDPKHDEKSKGHRDTMAKRYMIKMFLVDLHMNWRGIEGYPVTAPYSEGKLGIVHSK